MINVKKNAVIGGWNVTIEGCGHRIAWTSPTYESEEAADACLDGIRATTNPEIFYTS